MDPAGRSAVVIGGSGMLAGLCQMLAADGWQVTVVGRDEEKLARATAGGPRLHPLSVDYADVDAFAAALCGVASERGPTTLAVCWIRSWAPRSLLAAADAVAAGGRLFHVLGSPASDSSAEVIEALAARRRLRYRQVQLGAAGEASDRRWLSNEEISAGVHAAVLADRPYYLVGSRVL